MTAASSFKKLNVLVTVHWIKPQIQALAATLQPKTRVVYTRSVDDEVSFTGSPLPRTACALDSSATSIGPEKLTTPVAKDNCRRRHMERSYVWRDWRAPTFK